MKAPRNLKRVREVNKRPPAEPTRFDLDPRTAPTLSALGMNLTAAAARGELDTVVGRDTEIGRALDVSPRTVETHRANLSRSWARNRSRS